MRFSLLDLLRGFLKVLRNRDTTPSRPDVLARSILVVVPIGAGILVTLTNVQINSPGYVLTGIAILAGGFLTAFTHLSTLRQSLTSRQGDYPNSQRPDRDLIDEVATLLLVSAVAAVLTAVVLVIAMSATPITPKQPLVIMGWPAGVVAAMCAIVVLLFLLTIPRMYNAYLQLNAVRNALNGADRRAERPDI
jgi:hypothetical protein